MKTTPSEGIFYIVRYPTGWRIEPCRADTTQDPAHPTFWESQGLSKRVAQQWHHQLKKGMGWLHEELKSVCYGFPRGRVTKIGKTYTIYHGNDRQQFMKINKSDIEQIFGVSGHCKWEFDDHERCQAADKAAIRELLGIKEDWPAV